jgi:transaldolase
MNDRLKGLADAGVSIWLDDLSRGRLHQRQPQPSLIDDKSVTGVTTNPTIFAAALTGAPTTPTAQGLSDVDEVHHRDQALWAKDVRDACDLFADIYEPRNGYDGRVSIEVAPTLAYDTEATIEQAQELYDLVDRENVLIKIPATKEGLPAITETIGRGISVNVTLIFSEERYREVMDAYLAGLEQAAPPASTCRRSTRWRRSSSAASTPRSTSAWTRSAPTRPALKGKAAIANAEVALGAFDEVFSSDRFKALAAKGANKQRPLWASTGTKDPSYPDTLYVSDLVAKGVVNTMPEKTLLAYADHGEVGAPIEGKAAEGRQGARRGRRGGRRPGRGVRGARGPRAWRSSSCRGTNCRTPSRPPWRPRTPDN